MRINWNWMPALSWECTVKWKMIHETCFMMRRGLINTFFLCPDQKKNKLRWYMKYVFHGGSTMFFDKIYIVVNELSSLTSFSLCKNESFPVSKWKNSFTFFCSNLGNKCEFVGAPSFSYLRKSSRLEVLKISVLVDTISSIARKSVALSSQLLHSTLDFSS